MALSKIDITRTEGGLSRPPLSQDGISGMMFYDTTVLGFKKVTKVQDIEATFAKGTIEYYHIEKYFDFSDQILYVGYTTASTTAGFTEIVDLQNFASGDLRQIAVWTKTDEYVSTDITGLQTIADQLETEYAPAQILYSAKLPALLDTVEELVSLRTLDSSRVSYLIGEDYSSEVTTLRSLGHVSAIGACLGMVSRANVHENIGWVKNFNLTTTDFATIAFIDGSLYTDKSLTLLNSLDDSGYIFLRKYIGTSGSYFNYSYTATTATDDFATIENNRAYDKAFRNIRTLLLPEVNSPLYVKDSGELDGGTIKFFEGLTKKALQPMKDNREISSFSVTIDSKQNVLSTSKICIIAKIIPVGVAKEITVELGFALSI